MLNIAVVHKWMAGSGYTGSERVVEQILEIYPHADLYATVDFLDEHERAFLRGREVQTSFIQNLPFAKKLYKHYLPLAPLAVEQYDLSEYDIVISSNHAVAKGVLVGPDQLHVSYVHSPMRYAWDLQHQYLRESGLDKGIKGWLAKRMLHRMRIWDVRTANGVDRFVANSQFIARRIMKVYRRESTVIYPPVDVDGFELHEEKENFYLAASRLVPYKRIDLIAEAFRQMPDRRLVIIGDGPEMKKVSSVSGPNVEILGYQPFQVLRDHMQRAKAFVFAAVEDFGIMPVEAQACGTPVIAFGRGGALETVQDLSNDQPTGLFFDVQSVDSLVDAVRRFEQNQSRLIPASVRDHALKFGAQRFRREFADLVTREMESFGRAALHAEANSLA